MDRFCYL